MWEKIIGLFSGGKNPIDSIFDGIDKLSTSAEEKEVLRLEAVKLELAKQQRDFDDRANARSLYGKDSIMQKIFAFSFLVGYFILTWYILQLYSGNIEMTETASNFMYMIFGAISANITVIVSFFFGSSSTGNNTNPNNIANGSNK